jgi:hypothetical protein
MSVSVKEDDRSTGANVNKANLGVENLDPTPRMRVKRTDFNIRNCSGGLG